MNKDFNFSNKSNSMATRNNGWFRVIFPAGTVWWKYVLAAIVVLVVTGFESIISNLINIF